MSVDTAQYEHLAAIYDSGLQVPIRRCDTANFLAAIEPIQGSKVLDLATGTGYFARRMSRLGAARVVGVDVSEGMLQVAQRLSSDDSLVSGGVHYVLGDVFGVLSLREEEKEKEEEEAEEVKRSGYVSGEGTFDLVTGVWCLNYAGNRDMMQIAWQNIARFLKPGGRFVGIVPGNLVENLRDNEVYYGFSYERLEEVEDGWLAKKTINAEQGPFSFKAYLLNEDVYRGAAEAAGMRDVRIDKPQVVPELQGDEKEDFWEEFLAKPIFKVMTAVKP